MKLASTVLNDQATAMAMVVPNLGIVQVKGNDAIKVLGGLCTANLKDLEIGSAKEALFTDDRGRVTVHSMVARGETDAWILGQMHDPTALSTHIDRFIFREDAIPRNVTAEWFGLLIDGQDARLRLTDGIQPTEASGAPTTDRQHLDLQHLDLQRVEIENLSIQVARLPITGPNSLLCFTLKDGREVLERLLRSRGFDFDDGSEFEQRRVQNFWPVFGHEITDRTLPQELDRDERAISFTKGCYLGQETVARLDALGEVQKKLCLVRLDSDRAIPDGSALVTNGKEVGRLTSIAPKAIGNSRVAMAFMRRGSFAVGTSFQLGQAGDIFGEVISHP